MFNSDGLRCYGDFPVLEVHTEPKHGDVCRKTKDKNWRCPKGCSIVRKPKSTNGRMAPFCKLNNKPGNKPCRGERGIKFVRLLFINNVRIHVKMVFMYKNIVYFQFYLIRFFGSTNTM